MFKYLIIYALGKKAKACKYTVAKKNMFSIASKRQSNIKKFILLFVRVFWTLPNI